MNYLKDGIDVISTEIKALQCLQMNLNENFNVFAEEIAACDGRTILTGMGKSGHVCRKIVATMQSLGIKSYFMHPAEALHGDLGILTKNDLVIAFSNGGETTELLSLIPAIQHIGARLFSVIGRTNSTLEKLSNNSIILPEMQEAYLGTLVPTSSTTAMMALGDAWAVSIAKMRNFTATDFGMYHPNGLLGKRLTLKVSNLMLSGNENSCISVGSTVQQAILEMCNKPIGGVNIINSDGTLAGIFTDGDMRRLFAKNISNVMDLIVDNYMTKKPITISEELLVSDVITHMNEENHIFSYYPVVDQNKIFKGALRLLDVSKVGLFGYKKNTEVKGN